MSRPGPSAPRNLSLTEELEKLEQSITLTLQEIDHNFSKAHRIVTTSILPLVEQYGEHSEKVWEASKFWKQFFEASANVSLSGYEELANDEDTTTAEETTVHDETTADYTPRHGDETVTGGQATHHRHGADDSMLDDGDGDLSGSTPRPPATKSIKAQFALMDSPYEALRREMRSGGNTGPQLEDESTESELLAQRDARLPDMSMTPRSSLRGEELGEADELGALPSKDRLLHRMLDKNYRLQATPLKGPGLSPMKWKVTEKTQEKEKVKAHAWQDSSPMSSPEMPVPTLRTEAFMSPIRPMNRSKVGGIVRTPGISVQTPATARKTRDVFASQGKSTKGKDEIFWESDSDREGDLYGGMSPPKTINFAIPPSKLLQTPAREASKRIVEDILLTAGAEPDESAEYSPTMVKMNDHMLDDTF